MSNMQVSSFFEYVKSSVLTFIATFALAVLPGFDNASLTKAGIISLVMVGVRAGIKAILEILSVIKPTVTIQ